MVLNMNDIHENGFWSGETAYLHHHYCIELGKWVGDFIKDKDKTIYDFGCGLGNYLNYLKEQNFTKLVGFEGEIPKNKVYDLIIEKDLTVPFLLSEKGNVISFEVGEHIPKRFQDIYIDNITNNCNNYLIMSWAIIGQTGFGHVNCLDNEEVITEVTKRGFNYLEKESMEAREVILENTLWFKNTLLIFKKL
jgi:SAM-dependent methyltransferase